MTMRYSHLAPAHNAAAVEKLAAALERSTRLLGPQNPRFGRNLPHDRHFKAYREACPKLLSFAHSRTLLWNRSKPRSRVHPRDLLLQWASLDRIALLRPVMATILIRASGSGVRSRASRGSAVVVMEPPEARDARDAALELGRTRNRLLLRESLVWTRLVVETHELGDEASEVVLAEEEHVVEQLPAQGAREPFGERVHVRCLGCNSARHAPLTMPERG